MRKLLLVTSLFAVKAFAHDYAVEAPIELPVEEPTDAEQRAWYTAKTLEIMRDDEFFAGREMELTVDGKTHYIDRRAEPKPTTISANSRASQIGTLLKGLGFKGNGGLKIKIITETFRDGVIAEREIWEIDGTLMWQAMLNSDMNDAAQKHKK